MDWQNAIYTGIGIASVLLYADAVRPILRISKQTGIPLHKLDVVKSLSLDGRLHEWSHMIPTREPESVFSYIKEKVGESAAIKASQLMVAKEAPFPSYWDKMYQRSLVLKKKVAQIYQLPEISDYLRV